MTSAWWFWPLAATLILIAIHTYFGLHVISRKVLFVDLAIAQIAALGGTVAFLFGFEQKDPITYWVSLFFGVLGAWVFSVTRTKGDRVPHEAIIGLSFAIASAGAILLSAENPHGAEHLRDMLAGSILVVTPREVRNDLVIYSAVGLLHFLLRKKFIQVSLDPEGAARAGLDVQRWDFLFYMTFAVIVTMSVHIAGVLLVFCLLIAPSVCAAIFAENFRTRLIIGWVTSIVAAGAGLWVSGHFDWPPAPSIIAVYAVILVGAGVLGRVLGAENRLRAIAQIGAAAAVLFALGAGIVALLRSNVVHRHEDVHAIHAPAEHDPGTSQSELVRALSDEHDNVRASAAHELGKSRDPAVAPHLITALRDPSTAVREQAAEALGFAGGPEAQPALEAALDAKDEDEWVRLRAAESLVRLGAKRGISALLELTRSAEAKAVRAEAKKLALAACGRAPDAKLEGLESCEPKLPR